LPSDIKDLVNKSYFGFIFYWIPVILSLILGIIALKKIKNNKALGDRKLAIAGILISIFTIIFTLITILLLARSLSNF